MSSILETLSLVSVIWIIAAGVLIFLLLFLFGKRQIMRFTLKSSGGPHMKVGAGAPKELRMEIQRRLNRVPEIKFEPILLNPVMEEEALSGQNQCYWRMKAVDSFADFDKMMKQEVPAAVRHPNQTVRNYLLTIYPVYLSNSSPELVQQFLELYEHARHRPEPFDESHYNKYITLLGEMLTHLEEGLKTKKEANIERMKKSPLIDTEVTLKSQFKGISKTKTSIPYNQMGDKHSSRGNTRYRTRGTSSEQAGLLESGPSSLRSSVEGLAGVGARDSSEEKIQLVNMNQMPDII